MYPFQSSAKLQDIAEEDICTSPLDTAILIYHLSCISKSPLPSPGDSASLGSRWAGFGAESRQYPSLTFLIQREAQVLASRPSAHRMARGLCSAGQHTMGRQEYRSSVSVPRHFPVSGITGGLRKCLENHIQFLKSSDQTTEMFSVCSTEERQFWRRMWFSVNRMEMLHVLWLHVCLFRFKTIHRSASPWVSVP